MREIIIENAHENNLKNVSLRIPHYQLIAVTGVSGSGKTSLVYDVLCAEGQRLLFENFIGGRLQSAAPSRPKVDRIEGLFPVIAIDQNHVVRNPRSTVGTLTEIYDLLRLLFARIGTSDLPDLHPTRSLFSFNLPDGYCPICKGLGVQDRIDPDLLVGDPSKTIREGAFVLTTPNNYIVYSQVTMAVLNQVCEAEGFSVNIPWQDLSEIQKEVVLNGSKKIKVLFGKHPLESRLKWTGITAKPREEDYYKGILTVMEDILRRERNPNIMRFARTRKCEACGGKRLNERALSFRLWGEEIPAYAGMTIREVDRFFRDLVVLEQEARILEPVRDAILRRTHLLLKLGTGHLSLDRESPSLSGGEAQRIRLANQAASGLRHVLYILDEPSAGLHPSEHRDLLEVMRSLVSSGNTVLLVDHDEQSIREADWIIDIGPGAGKAGGKILHNGPANQFFESNNNESITWSYLTTRQANNSSIRQLANLPTPQHFFNPECVNRNNLKDISPRFVFGGLNVITGVSGSGKTSLVDFMLENTLKKKSNENGLFRKVIHVDASPIGRTPKSNPATYTGLSDHVRDLLAALPESKNRNYKKGQFSFVVKGGRCESCGGGGVQQVGMHFLGNVQVVCDVCDGKRFTNETLEIKYQGLNIFEILELTVDEAHPFFQGQKKITTITGILIELGLGYLKLGQPSTSLSGGEAQRVKLATELSRSAAGSTLYILDEPTTGLHMADVETLLKALNKLCDKGHTILCIEHDPAFILHADWMVDLGPGSAHEGGSLIAEGFVNELIEHPASITSAEIRSYLSRDASFSRTKNLPCDAATVNAPIQLLGVETNNLKNIDVAFEVNTITAVTGVSGSGKSSLVYGTLYAESQRRFFEGMSSRIKQSAVKTGLPVVRETSGLVPSISLQKKNPVKNPRSTVATYTGLYDLYRLLFSRIAKTAGSTPSPLSSAFSFNSEAGACPVCKGIGSLTVCDPDKLVTHPDKPVIEGALNGTKTGRFYGDPYGQYVAALKKVGEVDGLDFSVPWRELNTTAKKIAMEGCGEEIFEVEWKYKRGTREGVHHLQTAWPGFLKLVETEYLRKHTDARGEAMLTMMKQVSCKNCDGYRLKPELLSFRVNGLHIGEVSAMSAEDATQWFNQYFESKFTTPLEEKVAGTFQEPIAARLEALQQAGLEYLATDRIVGTLSGGEYQRLQLAGLVRAPLTGVAYILDEPSFGLHPKNTQRISDLILRLKNHGNTIVMVDHSPLLMTMADNHICLDEGRLGDGEIGELEDWGVGRLGNWEIGTGSEGLGIVGAYANNLQNIDVDIPSGVMTVITGVSGSGKTSLLDRVIYPSYQTGRSVLCERITGYDHFSDLIYIEQPLPGKGHTATVGSLLGISESLSKIFAASDEAKSRRLKASRFLRGARDGRCPNCEGTGIHQVSMDFFTDVITPCETCDGTGFTEEVLGIRIDHHSIWDAHQIQLNSMSDFWNDLLPSGKKASAQLLLELIDTTGIGHLTAGRTLKTLSTGELQRLKLVSGLTAKTGDHFLILLDEPTGGLHPKDILRLLKLFNDLITKGNSIVCVTHEPMLIEAAGKVVELGPGGGSRGGRIIRDGEQ